MLDHDSDRITKRIRQACASCRRRKTKCSGEKPVCFHCRRSGQRCVYEPYSMTTPAPAPQDNNAIMERINMLESRLAELSDRPVPQSIISPVDMSFGPLRFNNEHSLPPSPVIQSVVQTFFTHVHNRPYSYIQEASFRRNLELGLVPNCLLLVVLASAVRFSEHEYYEGRKQEATDAYVKASWMAVLTEHLTLVDNLNIEVVQTVNLLAIVDYTAGHVSSAWLKVGLAARISQDLRLMIDPSDTLAFAQQEERRRVFWSGYLLDRLISCGKSRPLCFHDDDCHVRLPCDEEALQNGHAPTTQTLHELLSWDSGVDNDQPPSPFGLVILTASVFGRCTRYVHRECSPDKAPPWDTTSEFSKINSSLLLLESYCRSRGIDKLSIHKPEAEQVVFAHTLFHLCHCLLNHPFLLRLRLRPFGSKVPASFALRVLQAGSEHANQLLDLVQEAREAGFPLQSSFYPYCLVVAGGIQSLMFHYESSRNDPRSTDTLQRFHQSFSTLERLAGTWSHAANMTVRLGEFHAQGHFYASLPDPVCITDEMSEATITALWTMIDYGTVGSSVGESPNCIIPNVPSPSWDIFNTVSLDGPNLIESLTPCTQFNREMDTLLHSC